MARLRYLQNKRSGTAGTISKSTNKLHFYDDGMYIYASADGVLNIISDTTLNLTAPTITLTGSTAVTLTGTMAGIVIGGTYDHGIRFSEDPTAGDNTNSFINIGDYGTALAVAPTTAHMFGEIHNVALTTSVAYWYQAKYTKITTSGTTTLTSIAGHAIRMQVGSSLGAVYGIQCHTNITATNTCAQEIASISTMVDLTAATVTTTDRVVALQALVAGSGTVTGLLHVAYFGNRGTQVDTDAIVFINNQSAATSDVAIEFDLNGVCTNVFEFNGTVCDAFDHNDRTSEYGAFDQCIMIPVKVVGESAQLYLMAAETWASVD